MEGMKQATKASGTGAWKTVHVIVVEAPRGGERAKGLSGCESRRETLRIRVGERG